MSRGADTGWMNCDLVAPCGGIHVPGCEFGRQVLVVPAALDPSRNVRGDNSLRGHRLPVAVHVKARPRVHNPRDSRLPRRNRRGDAEGNPAAGTINETRLPGSRHPRRCQRSSFSCVHGTRVCRLA